MTTKAGCARCDELAEEIGQLHAEQLSGER